MRSIAWVSVFVASVALLSAASADAASPCAKALEQGAVCSAANVRALGLIKGDGLEAITVVQDVQTGALVAFAASEPSKLDVGTAVLPLSLTKLLLAASWWDHDQPDMMFANATIHDMLVGSIDSAGREMAIALRKSIGTKAVLGDLKRYGFGAPSDAREDFWGERPDAWAARLDPGATYVSLSEATSDVEWSDTFSIGEANARTTALHVSRFMQAVGNNGMLAKPIARMENAGELLRGENRVLVMIRVMQKSTAARLQSAMRDTVTRGTARSIANALDGTGWQIGGRTGSGPGPVPAGSQLNGWFAGLIFDPSGRARFTVATFVRHGGLGGGKAAKISAALALFLIRGP